MKKYRRTFEFVKTEDEAKTFCNRENATGTYYKRKNHKAIYTPWSSQDGKEHLFVCWYYV